MSETCQKLASTHPVVVSKSGLKNNWMKKLDLVNRPLSQVYRALSGRMNVSVKMSVDSIQAPTSTVSTRIESG